MYILIKNQSFKIKMIYIIKKTNKNPKFHKILTLFLVK